MNKKVYQPFPKADIITNWGKLLKMSREEVIDLYRQWQTIHSENTEIGANLDKEKTKKIELAIKALKEAGIDVYKYSKNKLIPKKTGYQAWFKNNVIAQIEKQYPSYNRSIPTAHMYSEEVDGVTLHNNQSPTSLVILYDRITYQYNDKMQEKAKIDQLLVKSIEYATVNAIDIEDLHPQEVFQKVQDIAKDKYLEDHVPEGTEVELKHECSDCSTYIMGDHRCSCGNRRIAITVKGNLIDGFYHYPEGY